MADKIDVARLAREADEYSWKWCQTNWYTDGEPQDIRDEHFARLVMRECQLIALAQASMPECPERAQYIAEAIAERMP